MSETKDVLARLEYALKTGMEDAPMVHKGICQSALVDTLPALRDELTRLRADNARLRKIEQSHHNLCEMIDGMTKSEAYRAALAGEETQK